MSENDKSAALVEEVLKDARVKAERVRKKAGREADKIRADVLAQAKADLAEIEARNRDESERIRRTVMAVVPLEMRRINLKVQEQAVDAVLEKARKTVASLNETERRTMLLGWAVEALRAITADAVAITFSPEDARAVGAGFVDDLKRALAEDVPAIDLKTDRKQASPGLVVTSHDGHQVVDNTLPARFARMRRQLRDAVVELLFPPGEPEVQSKGKNNTAIQG